MTCARCGGEKPVDRFELVVSGRTGQPFRRRTCKDCRNARGKTERGRAVARASYLRRREGILERKRQWDRDHPADRARRQKERDRDKPRRADLRGDAMRWARVLLRDPCAYCGAPAEHIDHIIARRAGGPDAPDNLTASCASCNLSKLHRPLLIFLLERVP